MTAKTTALSLPDPRLVSPFFWQLSLSCPPLLAAHPGFLVHSPASAHILHSVWKSEQVPGSGGGTNGVAGFKYLRVASYASSARVGGVQGRDGEDLQEESSRLERLARSPSHAPPSLSIAFLSTPSLSTPSLSTHA